jgi:hypothetical protein
VGKKNYKEANNTYLFVVEKQTKELKTMSIYTMKENNICSTPPY